MSGFGFGFGFWRQRGGGLNWANWAAGLTAAQLLDVDFAKTDRHWQDVTGQTLADDAGEPIALAMDSGAWAGRTLAGEVDGQAELRETGTVGIVGSTTPATYNPATGVATVSRTSYPGDQSYVTFPVEQGAYYEIDMEHNTVQGINMRPNTFAAIVAFTASGRNKYRVASATNEILFTVGANGATGTFTVHSLKRVHGNHGTASGGARPGRQAGGVARFDGSDDNLLTSYLAQSGPMTLLYHGTVPASLAALQVMLGASGSAVNRCWLGVTTAGALAGGVGGQSSTTILGTRDVRDKEIVAALTFDGSTVKLFLRVDGVTTEEYSAAQASTPTTSVPFRIGALNNNGAPGSFATVDAHSFKAAHKSMTLAEFAAISTKLLP